MKRGFTLVELLIAISVMAILATALTRLLLSDSRFVSQQEALMTARQTARAANNVMAVELRMVSDSGLLAAAAESVTVRVPYAFGMACDRTGADRIASLMPVDSLMYALAVASGIAVRTGSTYTFPSNLASVAAAAPGDAAKCSDESISVVPGGKLVAIRPQDVADIGDVFYLYQTVTYRFSASTDLPGRIGLWRRVGGAAYEEMVAPFDSTARFRFLIGANLHVTDVPPADLETVAGLELKLVSQSYVQPQGRSDYQTFDLPVQVVFLNRAN